MDEHTMTLLRELLEKLPLECESGGEHEWDEGDTLEQALDLASYCNNCGLQAYWVRVLEDTRELLVDLVDRPSTGADLISDERLRQIVEEGWTPALDDRHTRGQLIRAAASYLLADMLESGYFSRSIFENLWPWEPEWWKPAGARRNLEKAGALIAAELDRMERAQ